MIRRSARSRSRWADFNRLAGMCPTQDYCHAVLGGKAIVDRWQNIPAVPQQAFKRFALRTFPEAGNRADLPHQRHDRRRLRQPSFPFAAAVRGVDPVAGWRHFSLPERSAAGSVHSAPGCESIFLARAHDGCAGRTGLPRANNVFSSARTAAWTWMDSWPWRRQCNADHAADAACSARRWRSCTSATPWNGAAKASSCRAGSKTDGNRRLQGHRPDA